MPESRQHNTGQGWKVRWVLRVGAKESGGWIQEQALSEEMTASHFKTKERLESLDLEISEDRMEERNSQGQSVADKKEHQECGAVRQE